MTNPLRLAAALCVAATAAPAQDDAARVIMTMLDAGCVVSPGQVPGVFRDAGVALGRRDAILGQLAADGALWIDDGGRLHISDHLCHPGNPDRRSREVLVGVLRANGCALPAGSLPTVAVANNIRPEDMDAAAQFLLDNGYADGQAGGALTLHGDICRG